MTVDTTDFDRDLSRIDIAITNERLSSIDIVDNNVRFNNEF